MTRLYRGLDCTPEPITDDRPDLVWWTIDFDRAWGYTFGAREGHILSVVLDLDALRLRHEANEHIGLEDTSGLLADLRDVGDHGVMHDEGGARTIGLLPEVVAALTIEARSIEQDMDDWWG